jgi:hypothetical protein
MSIDPGSFIKKDDEYPSSFDPVVEYGIQTLSPYFFPQEMSETPPAPPSMMFGFVDPFEHSSSQPDISSSFTPEVPTPTCAFRRTAPSSFSGLQQQHVHMAQISQSPVYGTTSVSQEQVCDPKSVNEEDPSNTIDISIKSEVQANPTTLSPSVSYTSEDDGSCEDDDYCDSENGEDEDDPEFTLRPSTNGNRSGRRSGASSFANEPDSAHDGSESKAARRPRGFTTPIPVPNLTKKSRGRRVPTVSSGGVQKTPRNYLCTADGCGKCFARGEHLKRHVRSIHTNEKRTSYHLWSATYSLTDTSRSA